MQSFCLHINTQNSYLPDKSPYKFLISAFAELTGLVPVPYSSGGSSCCTDRLHDFFVTIPRCYKDLSVNSFSPRLTKLVFST